MEKYWVSIEKYIFPMTGAFTKKNISSRVTWVIKFSRLSLETLLCLFAMTNGSPKRLVWLDSLAQKKFFTLRLSATLSATRSKAIGTMLGRHLCADTP